MKIIVAPLDWGLGHATRCIPIIRQLISDGNEVLIAGDGNVHKLLQQEFPQLKFIHLKGYHVSYSTTLPAWFKILVQLPKIISRIIIEHRELKNIIAEHHPDMVISDNRFGLWNKKVKSIYITHQVMIKCPRGFKLFERPLYMMHRWIINHYDECRIPDCDGNENVSGDLSHKYEKPKNAKYIGILSRFKAAPSAIAESSRPTSLLQYDLCIIISGPEPARSEFEKIIFHQLKSYQGKAIVILGNISGKQPEINSERVSVFSHLNAEHLQDCILKSKLVLCRAGYSGIMDLIALKKDAVLVPTPGQTEQEYLAEYLQKKQIFKSVCQHELNLKTLEENPAIYSVRSFAFGKSERNEDLSKIVAGETLTAYL